MSVATPLTAQEAVELKTPTGTLYGTLLVPATVKAPMPVALIIAGSGPTDRDATRRCFRARTTAS